jgi:hypothetical protein
MSDPYQTLHQLLNLLLKLPLSLPLDPSDSKYCFDIDNDDLEDKGVYGAANRRLEISFETHRCTELRFLERSKCIKSLEGLLRWTLDHLDTAEQRQFFADVWIDRLTLAAQASGATEPKEIRCVFWAIQGFT